ncbi:MAG: prolipoprotein diacylglyceryl transferase [Bacteroidetes bacterium]|nr:prolipoprotein diacylglyceryl transferase [Bacteroidota bacterium]
MNLSQKIVVESGFEKEKEFVYTVKIITVYFFIFWILLPGFLFSTGLRLDLLIHFHFPDSSIVLFLGWTCVLSGLFLFAVSFSELWFRGNGLPISHLPPVKFVNGGVYKYLRHPAYMGYTIVFAGAVILLKSFWSLIFCTPLLLFGWIVYSLFYEEPVLLHRFGENYQKYRKNTSLIFPFRSFAIIQIFINKILGKICEKFNKFSNRLILFQKGNFIIVTYGLIITAGTFIFMINTSLLLFAQKIAANHISVFLISIGISGILFGRLFWWLGHWRTLIQEPLWGLRKIGFVSWGAVAGIVLSAILTAYFYGYPFLVVVDTLMPGMFAAYGIGRIGCLSYGCCYGKQNKNFGIVYENKDSKAVREKGLLKIKRYPTQLFSASEGIFLFILLNVLHFYSLPAGFISAVTFILYPIGRTYVEFFRDRKRIYNSVLTEGHIGCFFMFLLGWLLLFIISPEVIKSSTNIIALNVFSESQIIFPVIFAMSFIVFIAAGVHWKKIGTL